MRDWIAPLSSVHPELCFIRFNAAVEQLPPRSSKPSIADQLISWKYGSRTQRANVDFIPSVYALVIRTCDVDHILETSAVTWKFSPTSITIVLFTRFFS